MQRSTPDTFKQGLLSGFLAYLWWGSFPLFFATLNSVSPFETVPWRVFTALAFCLVAVTVMRAWPAVLRVLRSPRLCALFVLSTVLVYANWQIFIYAIASGNAIEGTLGYFINPLLTILIGVVTRGEKLRRLQWLAVSIATVGVIAGSIVYGKVPFIALGVAVSFALYGAVHKLIGAQVDSLGSLTLETMFALPIALVQLVIVQVLAGSLGALTHGPHVTIPLLLSGVMTAIPLMLFTAATVRIPLVYIGFLQFLTPILGFATALFILHEPMPAERWVGVIAVWIAVAVLLIDMFNTLRLRRNQSASAEPKQGRIS